VAADDGPTRRRIAPRALADTTGIGFGLVRRPASVSARPRGDERRHDQRLLLVVRGAGKLVGAEPGVARLEVDESPTHERLAGDRSVQRRRERQRLLDVAPDREHGVQLARLEIGLVDGQAGERNDRMQRRGHRLQGCLKRLRGEDAGCGIDDLLESSGDPCGGDSAHICAFGRIPAELEPRSRPRQPLFARSRL
jgi:hypothetical protein